MSMTRTLSSISGLLLCLAGCASPPAKLMPVTPYRTENIPDGGQFAWYDLDGNGKPDYRERYSAEGRIVELGYDTDGDARIDDLVDIASIPESEQRHLLIMLDSIPWVVAEDVWQAGRLRFFPRPSKVISPFPVMTDVCFGLFFGDNPIPGVEAEYFDTETGRLLDGWKVYVNKGQAPWQAHVQYAMRPIAQIFAYTNPTPWYDFELGQMQYEFENWDGKMTVGYSVGTSSLGSNEGRNGHVKALVLADRLCHKLMHDHRGRVRISIMSDHGHNLVHSRRIPLRETLAQMGYNVTDRLEDPNDLVVPEFGIVTMASIHTLTPGPVARDVVTLDGIEFTFYMENDEVVVISRDGEARIAHRNGRHRYRTLKGDPFQLEPIIAALRDAGKVDAEGFIASRDSFEATKDHLYPDILHRMWLAFHGLVVNQPDVLVSLYDGYHSGSKTMTRVVDLAAAHGNIRPLSSIGFAMSMNGPLPEVMRMDDLRAELIRIGVPVPSKIREKVENELEAGSPAEK